MDDDRLNGETPQDPRATVKAIQEGGIERCVIPSNLEPHITRRFRSDSMRIHREATSLRHYG